MKSNTKNTKEVPNANKNKKLNQSNSKDKSLQGKFKSGLQNKFMTKKEKEAKELADKKIAAEKDRAKRMKELDKEVEEMKELVRKEVREPAKKRRNSLTSGLEMLTAAEQHRNDMPSCFDDGVSFTEYQAEKEHERLSRLEWRAQFKPLHEIMAKSKAVRENIKKVKKRDRSSDSTLLHNDLITTIHRRSEQSQINSLTEQSFWEKIGFKNKKKWQMMLTQGKEKVDETYMSLRGTMIQSTQLDNLHIKTKQDIADLKSE